MKIGVHITDQLWRPYGLFCNVFWWGFYSAMFLVGLLFSNVFGGTFIQRRFSQTIIVFLYGSALSEKEIILYNRGLSTPLYRLGWDPGSLVPTGAMITSCLLLYQTLAQSGTHKWEASAGVLQNTEQKSSDEHGTVKSATLSSVYLQSYHSCLARDTPAYVVGCTDHCLMQTKETWRVVHQGCSLAGQNDRQKLVGPNSKRKHLLHLLGVIWISYKSMNSASCATITWIGCLLRHKSTVFLLKTFHVQGLGYATWHWLPLDI